MPKPAIGLLKGVYWYPESVAGLIYPLPLGEVKAVLPGNPASGPFPHHPAHIRPLAGLRLDQSGSLITQGGHPGVAGYMLQPPQAVAFQQRLESLLNFPAFAVQLYAMMFCWTDGGWG